MLSWSYSFHIPELDVIQSLLAIFFFFTSRSFVNSYKRKGKPNHITNCVKNNKTFRNPLNISYLHIIVILLRFILFVCLANLKGTVQTIFFLTFQSIFSLSSNRFFYHFFFQQKKMEHSSNCYILLNAVQYTYMIVEYNTSIHKLILNMRLFVSEQTF